MMRMRVAKPVSANYQLTSEISTEDGVSQDLLTRSRFWSNATYSEGSLDHSVKKPDNSP